MNHPFYYHIIDNFFDIDKAKQIEKEFPDLHIRVRPEPGLLVCFPSNRYYRHGVEPVTRGNRYSMVTWMTVKGFESMETQSNNLKSKYGVC